MTQVDKGIVTRTGTIAIIGRPNVGKSTLLNKLLGQKISITSHKAQTTRYQILGILSDTTDQIVFVDTPGLTKGGTSALQRHLVREALRGLHDVDGLIFVVEALRWTEADEAVAGEIAASSRPTILVINKVDRVAEKKLLLPYIEQLHSRLQLHAVVPASARSGDNLDALLRCVKELLHPGAHPFPEELVTDRSERFIVAETIREKLLRHLDKEVPHKLSVVIDDFVEEDAITNISATIWVDRDSHKAIVIGKEGDVLKRVGALARTDIERMLGKRVFLRTWVKVKEGWSNDERALQQFGLDL